MVYEMKLRTEYFNLVKSGDKEYEVRLNDEKRRLINVGDLIVFKREPELKDSVNVKVKDLLYFKSFKDMAEALPLSKVGFAGKSIQETVDTYHKFYSLEDEKRNGVVAIKVEVLK